MEYLEITFWICLALVLYAYVGYAVMLALVVKWRTRPPQRRDGHLASISFVICAHNEAERIAGRITEMTSLLSASKVAGEIIVVSDGSTDGTAEKARQLASGTVRVIELPERVGKAVALSAGCAEARNEILVFADCRQRWSSSSVRMLLRNFADPAIGAVSGNLVLESSPGVMTGVGLYWRYEKWLRNQESLLNSAMGVTGAICAVRRSLFPGVPSGTILDDVYWPLCLMMKGHRVVFDDRAVAYDRLPDRTRDEFRRKVRTQAGNIQLVTRLPQSLLPWRNPVWVQFVSHKLLRLAVPWALLLMLGISAFLPGKLYQAMFWSQISFYLLAVLGNSRTFARHLRPAAAAASLVVLNAAAWLAFWVWITGRTGQSWSKVSYHRAGESGSPLPSTGSP